MCRFQLVGIGCLRAAMADVPCKVSAAGDEEEKKALDPSKFAYISDRTYTAEQVEQMTAVVQQFTSTDLRCAPNAKMFLRSFWYRSVQAGTMSSEEMHVYTLARCRPIPILPVWEPAMAAIGWYTVAGYGYRDCRPCHRTDARRANCRIAWLRAQRVQEPYGSLVRTQQACLCGCASACAASFCSSRCWT